MYGVPAPEDRDVQDVRKIELSTLVVDGERVLDCVCDYGDPWCCVVCAGRQRSDDPRFSFSSQLNILSAVSAFDKYLSTMPRLCKSSARFLMPKYFSRKDFPARVMTLCPVDPSSRNPF